MLCDVLDSPLEGPEDCRDSSKAPDNHGCVKDNRIPAHHTLSSAVGQQKPTSQRLLPNSEEATDCEH